MRGPRVQSALSRLLLLLLVVGLRGDRSSVFCQDYDPAAEVPEEETENAEVAEPETEEVLPEGEVLPEEDSVPGTETLPEEEPVPGEETTDPTDTELDPTPTATVAAVTDTEDEANGEEVGSGRAFDLGAAEESGSGEDLTDEEEGLGLLLIVVPVVVGLLIVSIVSGVFIHRRINSKNRHSDVGKEDPFLEGSSTEKVPMPMFEEDVPSVLELEMDELDDWMKKDGEPTDFSQQP